MRLRWPFRKACRSSADDELDAAHWEADRALVDAKHLRVRADGIGEKLRATGRRNHFGEAVKSAMRGA